MISNYEKQYIEALREIYDDGFADGINERTGMSTKRLPGIVFRVDVEKEFPILQSKFVAAKTAQREIEWIWKQQSNNINDLKAKIWNEWADENGSIGKAYGYQIAKPVTINIDPIHKPESGVRTYANIAEYIIEYLREFPNGRWGVATLWSREDLSEMNLVPCCHTSTWNLDGGRLNCVLDQRSGDMPYGVPFNTTQYAELMVMIAKALSTPEKEVKPGILTHVIADAHIYDNQMRGVELQLKYYEIMHWISNSREDVAKYLAEDISFNFTEVKMKADEIVQKAKEVVNSNPRFVVNAEKPQDFFSYTADDCKIEDYAYMDKIDFGDVAV